MSKAFTRESDNDSAEPVIARSSALPPGTVNYMTARGAQGLRDELKRLVEIDRPRLQAEEMDADRKRQLQTLDQRIAQLQQSIDSAEVVSRPETEDGQVRFGATVRVRGAAGEETYRIVGVDEADPARDEISWLSPIARALLNARRGERITVKLPGGIEELEILEVSYED